MEFNLELPQNEFFIRSVSEDGIRVHNDLYTGAFIISGEGVIPDWQVNSVEDLDANNLQVIFDLQPEVVLIGTGKKQVFLPPSLQAHFFRRNCGFEVMTTDAACRTFNILVGEGRNVVAALLPITP